MPRSAGTVQRDPENTRIHLLDVAEKCFERHGIGRTTMEDIAAEARVSRPTLYRYFGDRESLITAISQRRAAKFAGRMRAVLARYDTFEERLVEGMLHLGRVGQKDQFFSSLITPETVGAANQILMAPAAAIDFASEVWGPVLDEAEAAGQLRAGIDRQLAYQWLTSINILLIGWIDNAGSVKAGHRELLREFFTPAFVAE
jgi:AcrR family transcriptional regulator